MQLPISLEKGAIVTPEFHPALDTDYYISIEVQRKIEFQRSIVRSGLRIFISSGAMMLQKQ